MGARWMIANHYAELDPEYVIDEGGFGSRDLFASNKLVYGIAVAEKKLIWLKVRAEGVAGHGSQPNDQNPNDRLAKALGRLLGQPLQRSRAWDLDVQTSIGTMKSRVGTFAANKFTNAITHSTISLTWMRSGRRRAAEDQRDSVGGRSRPGLPRPAGHDARPVAGRDSPRLGDPALEARVINESDDPVVSPQDTPVYRALEAAILRSPSRRRRDADAHPLRHRFECLPAEGRQELRHLPRHPPRRRRLSDARRRGAHAAGGGARRRRGAVRRTAGCAEASITANSFRHRIV
jgi:acetylornithine deacetylase/succinyl-diaminopimelate desuccinylase-like protein